MENEMAEKNVNETLNYARDWLRSLEVTLDFCSNISGNKGLQQLIEHKECLSDLINMAEQYNDWINN